MIICADAFQLPMRSASVDLVITSPPYHQTRRYASGGLGEEHRPADWVDAMLEATVEMTRVLKPSGSLWINLGDCYRKKIRGGSNEVADGVQAPRKSLMGLPWRYALRCMDELGLALRAEVIWDKSDAQPESVKDRVRRTHETWFHFVLQESYYASVNAIRQPHKRLRRPASTAMRGQRALRPVGPNSGRNHPAGALPGSVWRSAVGRLPPGLEVAAGVEHQAVFPEVHPHRIITGWCPPAGVVLDPFSGSGTVARVAGALGRTGIGVDLSVAYCRLAKQG